MAGYFSYDADSGTGIYLDEKDIAEVGGYLAIGIGAYSIYAIIVFAIGLIVVSPFLTLAFLDNFVETFIVNNSLFFIGIGGLITVLKFISKMSGSRIVRFLFDVYIIVAALYVVLYVLNFDIPVYSFFKIIDNYLPENADRALVEVWGIDNLTEATKGNWFYELANTLVGKFIEYVKWAFLNLVNIDRTCFEVPIGEMNILAVLKSLGLYIVVGGFAILSTLIMGLLLLAVAVIVVILPYIIAIIVMFAINKLIYKITTAKILAIDEENYENALLIKKDLLEPYTKTTVGISPKEAFKIYEIAAKEGNPLGQVHLAQCYLHGEGTLEDDKQAFYWYQKAAFQGNHKAQLMMSFMHFDGIGTKKNRVLAKAWMSRALQNREFVERHSSKDNITRKIALILKKTKLSDYL